MIADSKRKLADAANEGGDVGAGAKAARGEQGQRTVFNDSPDEAD